MKKIIIAFIFALMLIGPALAQTRPIGVEDGEKWHDMQAWELIAAGEGESVSLLGEAPTGYHSFQINVLSDDVLILEGDYYYQDPGNGNNVNSKGFSLTHNGNGAAFYRLTIDEPKYPTSNGQPWKLIMDVGYVICPGPFSCHATGNLYAIGGTRIYSTYLPTIQIMSFSFAKLLVLLIANMGTNKIWQETLEYQMTFIFMLGDMLIMYPYLKHQETISHIATSTPYYANPPFIWFVLWLAFIIIRRIIHFVVNLTEHK